MLDTLAAPPLSHHKTNMAALALSATMTVDWSDTVRYCQYHRPDLIYVAIGCSQKRHAHPLETRMRELSSSAGEAAYGKHSPQECPPFVRQWVTRSGAPARSVCILIDPDLEDDLYAFYDLTAEELARTRFITVRRNFNWVSEASTADRDFIHALCDLAIHAPDTYLIVQDYSGEELRRYYPLGHPRFSAPDLLAKVAFDVGFMDGGCWLDFDKVRLERDATTGGFLQPPYMRLREMAAIATPDVLLFHAEQRYYTLLSYVWGFYRHPGERDWCSADAVQAKMGALPYVYGTPNTIDAPNLKALATHMLDDFAQTAGAELTPAEIATMLDEATEKALPSALSTLKLLITEHYRPAPAAGGT